MTNYVTKALRQEHLENISKIFIIFENEKYNLRNNNQMLVLAKSKTNAMMRSFILQCVLNFFNYIYSFK